MPSGSVFIAVVHLQFLQPIFTEKRCSFRFAIPTRLDFPFTIFHLWMFGMQ